ncbi:S-adenosyl-L-methionine-dependent methyltransferase [Auriscalpium vulgare]|uniref:S-adenosyl-L-methionine-dependent methyltransferase n=1 Tax=Auriscalpium vulgare TaxID=40419 RepID=A0ACB8R8Q7_9AGAM|nr:S-adenosyl-L-methionine-dependent methyltransferase [Auriscalpium vulgare]
MRLLRALQQAIGAPSAHNELRWMKRAIAASPATVPDLDTMVARRVAGEPLQYILGAQPFGPLMLQVRPPVLIPRPETEDWALRLASAFPPPPGVTGMRVQRALDLCTGSACIPLLLCAQRPPGTLHAVAVDSSDAALALARDNARACAVPCATDARRHTPPTNTLALLRADVLDTAALAAALRPHGPFDLLTANPPYITRAEYAELPPSVRDWEDPAALLGDLPAAPPSGGLAFYHAIAALLARGDVLRAGGWLALEVGAGQARAVAAVVGAALAGASETQIWCDPWGKERVVVAHGARR